MLLLIIFSFLFLFLFINSISLCFDPWIFCHLLANMCPSLWLFLVLFWMLRKLVTVNKLCNVLNKSQIATWGAIFMGILFSVSKEWVRFWSCTSLVTNLKTFLKNSWQSVQKHWQEREKEKERQLQSFLCIHKRKNFWHVPSQPFFSDILMRQRLFVLVFL